MPKQSLVAPGLLAAKFFQPISLKKRVDRVDLIQHLNQGLVENRPLTLISAPAGYGKSTLAAEWCGQIQQPVAWLTLDESDDEPLRFFLYFIAALQKLDETIGAELMILLNANQLPPKESLVTLLTNDLLNSSFPLICILDDFHNTQDSFILDTIQEIITRTQGHFHLVIVTREDPALPLGRLRAHNQLTEIRANDLRFSKEDTERFFLEVMQIRLSESDLSLLEDRTEGWVAGLQLAGLSMQGRESPSSVIASLSGSHRHILSYLTEEVLKQQTTDLQEFLLQTSILSRFNADLCNAVTGRKNSAALLEQLFAANLFLIPLDDNGNWYRYHHLFADLLLNLLKRNHPDQVRELHVRASYWHRDQQMPLDATDHALAAEDSAEATRLLEEHAWTLLNQGFTRRIEIWMNALPAEWRVHSPRTNLSFAWMHMLRGNFPKVVPYLQQAESALENLQGDDNLRAECLALKSNLLQTQGRIAEAIEAAQHSLQLVDSANVRILGLAYLGLGAGYRQAVEFDRAVDALQHAIRASRESGDSVTGALATTHLVLMSLQHGRLRFAEEVSSQTIERMERSSVAPSPIIGAVYGALGLVYYERNQIEQARDCLLRGIQLGNLLGHNASLIYTKLNLARLLQAEADPENAAKNIRESAELVQLGAPGWLRPMLVARQVQYHIAVNNLAEAESVLRQSGIAAGEKVEHATDEIQLAYVRTMLRRGTETDLLEGVKLAERVLALAESGQRNNTSIQALILGALSYEASGDSKSSIKQLKRAIELAEPEKYIRIFVDEGRRVAPLLQRLPKTDYVKKLLAAFPTQQRISEPSDGLIEPLSDRELEVLRLLARGMKYAEIAEQLVVSVNTVRYHIKGIYQKLNVDKQAKAIERARELGLLE